MSSLNRKIGATLAGSAVAAGALLAGLPAASAAPATPTSSTPYRLVLISLDCRETEDWTGPDEAYLRVQGVTRWGPTSMNDGDSVDINRSVAFAATAKIRLYDEDTGIFDDDDFLGEVTASGDQVGQGEQYGKFTRDGAHYELTYKVVRNRW